MKRLSVFLLTMVASSWCQDTPPATPPAGRLATIAAQLRTEGLDPQECYRVRNLTIARDELRVYLSEGLLIFAKPINGRRLSAVFSTGEDGDAEVLLMPPLRSERLSLANFNNGVPNLTQHFRNSLLLFTDDTGAEIRAHIEKSGAKPDLENGALLASQWSDTLLNIYSSFSVRLAADLLDSQPDQGFFFTVGETKTAGTLDLMFDPRTPQQITVGRLTPRDDRLFYDVWCHFEGRSWRTGRRPPPQPEFKLSNYRISASIAPDLRVSVVTTVAVTPEMPLASIGFDISPQMRVLEAKVDGKPAEVFGRESLRADLLRGGSNEMFLVAPDTPLEKGHRYEVEIRHEGDVVVDSGNGVYFVGSRGNWYPNRDLQFADYDLIYRYPKALTLVSTGDVLDERTEGDFHIVHRKTSGPVRLAGFNLGDYQKYTAHEGAVTVEVYANRRVETALARRNDLLVLPPLQPWQRHPSAILSLPPGQNPDPTQQAQALAIEIGNAYEFYRSRFGPSPVTRLTVSPIPGRFGQGFPGLIYLSTLSYLKPQDRPDSSSPSLQMFFSELLHAHEVAHQWWGNLVTTDGYQDGWIMEGLANYSALMYLEKKKGTRVMEDVLEDYKHALLAKKKEDGKTIESMGPITWGLRLESSQAPTAYQTITYQKGSWIFHMLRRRMGDTAFQDMLVALIQRYRYRAVSVPQLQALAAEFLPKGLPDPTLELFFDNWIYDVGIPTLKMSHTTKGKAPNIVLSGTIQQTEVGDQFTTLVPVEITTAKGKIVKWVATGEDATFTVKLASLPSKVVLDGSGSVLAIRR
jgi:hypothetical protein